MRQRSPSNRMARSRSSRSEVPLPPTMPSTMSLVAAFLRTGAAPMVRRIPDKTALTFRRLSRARPLATQSAWCRLQQPFGQQGCPSLDDRLREWCRARAWHARRGPPLYACSIAPATYGPNCVQPKSTGSAAGQRLLLSQLSKLKRPAALTNKTINPPMIETFFQKWVS